MDVTSATANVSLAVTNMQSCGGSPLKTSMAADTSSFLAQATSLTSIAATLTPMATAMDTTMIGLEEEDTIQTSPSTLLQLLASDKSTDLDLLFSTGQHEATRQSESGQHVDEQRQTQEDEAILTELAGLIDFVDGRGDPWPTDQHHGDNGPTLTCSASSPSASSGCSSLASSVAWTEDEEGGGGGGGACACIGCGEPAMDSRTVATYVAASSVDMLVDWPCSSDSFNEGIFFGDEGFSEQLDKSSMASMDDVSSWNSDKGASIGSSTGVSSLLTSSPLTAFVSPSTMASAGKVSLTTTNEKASDTSSSSSSTSSSSSSSSSSSFVHSSAMTSTAISHTTSGISLSAPTNTTVSTVVPSVTIFSAMTSTVAPRDPSTKLFVCPHCPERKTFRYFSRLQRHLTTHDQYKRFECPDCHKLFSRSDVLDTHRTRVHGQKRPASDPKASAEDRGGSCDQDHGDGRLKCPLGCGAVSASRHHLERHLRAHAAKASQHECPECPRVLRGRRALRRHLRSAHGQGVHGGHNFMCTECGASFTQKQLLVRHQRTHSGELPFECTECGKKFNQAGNLRQHKARMHGDVHGGRKRPHRCSKCPKSFHSAAELKNHETYHSGVRGHACGHCGAAFFERRHLERHCRRVHAGGVRPYFCADCGRTFVERYELNFHRKRSCPTLSTAAAATNAASTDAAHSVSNAGSHILVNESFLSKC